MFDYPQNCLWNTKPRLLGRCCYKLVFFLSWMFYSLFVVAWCGCLVALLDFFSVGLCVEKNTNVPPKALGCLLSLCNLCN